MEKRKVYLDNNATTPLHPEVKKAIEEYLDIFGNPSSMHEFGRIAGEKFKTARKQTADFFNVPENDIIFTSCGSESNNTVLKSVLFNDYGFKPHIITDNIEHPAVRETAKFLKKQGADITELRVDKNGVVSLEDLENSIRKETVLISIMYANNEIGTIQPVKEIGEIAHKHNILFHTDAVQAAGKIKFDLPNMNIDFASFSGHKIYAPKGIGILYVKNAPKNLKKLTPLIHGGHQEHAFRAGTENTIGITALGKACEVLKRELDSEIERVERLRNLFESEVKKRIPHIIINGEEAPRLPGTSNITFKFIEGESILLRLDLEGIAVSTGSACSTGSLEPSHVIVALSHSNETAHGSVRFSFGRENSEEDVYYTLEVLEKQVRLLRMMSPVNEHTKFPTDEEECPYKDDCVIKADKHKKKEF